MPIIIDKYILNIKNIITYTIGKNAQDNFNIIDESNPNDIWFHVEDRPSNHVIAKIPPNINIDKKMEKYIIKQGAILCKQYSKCKSESNVPIVFTKIHNVKKTSIIGSVETIDTKILFI